MAAAFNLGLVLAAFGCSRPAAGTPPVAQPPVPSPNPTVETARATKPLDPAPDSSRAVVPAPAAATCAVEFTQILAEPALSAAVGVPTGAGHSPRAATWSGRHVTLFEDGKPRELPAPRLPDGAVVEVFFGRDNQPRLMGFVPGQAGKEVPVYRRFRHGAFAPEPSELGPLAAPRGALYGVLGFADPEVVCRPRELCLVKRTTGWGRVAAQAEPVRIVLRGGSVFALHADHIERLDAKSWSTLDPARPFEHPRDAWLAPNGELWVVDASETGVFRLKSGKWEGITTPVSEPRAVFGRSEHEVFVAGKNGAAEYDGALFRCVRGTPGPLSFALAVGDEVWLGGESGVYRSAR